MFSDALKRIGIDADKLLERLSSEGWTQNISKLQGYVSMAFQRIGESAFMSLIKPLRGVNDFLGRQFKEGSRGGGIFREIGSSMEAFIKPSIEYLQQFGHELWKNREIAVSFFRSMSGSMINGAVSFAQIFTSFGKGLSGQKNSDGVHERVQGILGLMKTMERFGESAGKFFNSLIDPVNRLGLSINSLVSELVKLGTGHTGASGTGGLVGGLMNLASVGANAGAGAIGGVNSVLGNNGNASTGIMDKLQAGGNYLLTAGMLYSMFRFKNRGASTGTTGIGAMGAGGQALANEERMIAQNGVLSYEQRYAQNAGMRNVLERKNANELAIRNLNNQHNVSTMNIRNPYTNSIQTYKQKEIDIIDANILLHNKKSNLQTQLHGMTVQNDRFNVLAVRNEIKNIEQQQLNLQNERVKIQTAIYMAEQNSLNHINLVNEKNKQFQQQKDILLQEEKKILANELKEKERMNKRESYFNSENINTGLNAVMTAGMIGQMASGMGGTGAGATGLMASSMPTFAGWGTALATSFATTFGMGITTMLTSVVLPAIVMGVTAYGITDRITQRHSDYERQIREENDSIQNSEADINLSKANTRRQIAQRNFFKNNGIDPVKMTAMLQGTSGGQELAGRYSQSSPENQKAMQAMSEGFKQGIFSPSELKSKYGEGGADAVMSMDMVVKGGSLSIEGLSPKVRKELTDAIYDKLVHSGAIKAKGAGVEGKIDMTKDEQGKQNFSVNFANQQNGIRTVIPLVPSKG